MNINTHAADMKDTSFSPMPSWVMNQPVDNKPHKPVLFTHVSKDDTDGGFIMKSLPGLYHKEYVFEIPL